MKKVFLIIFAFLLYANLNILADGISVKSFKLIKGDQTARNSNTKKYDQHGNQTALIKIITNESGLKFNKGNIVSIVRGIAATEEKPEEIWLYVLEGAGNLIISHKSFGVLNYKYPIPIQGGWTYEMQLVFSHSSSEITNDNYAGTNEPAIKVRTEQKDGFTIEHYDKNGKEYTLWKKPNGEFYLSDNNEYHWMSYCHFTLSDGTIIDGNNDYYIKGGQDKLCTGTDFNSFVGVKVKFPNGNYYLLKGAPIDWFKWTNGTCEDLLSEYGRKRYNIYYVFADRLDKLLPFDEERMGGMSDDVTIGDKVYSMNPKDGNLILKYKKLKYMTQTGKMKVKQDLDIYVEKNMKELEGLPEEEAKKLMMGTMEVLKEEHSEIFEMPVTPQDSLKNYEYDKDHERFKVTYANGDVVFIKNGRWVSDPIEDGTRIHKENGLLEYKDNQVYFTLKDGRKFRAQSFKEVDHLHKKDILAQSTLTPWYGLMINTDNTGVKIVEGISEEEKAAKDEAERKKAEAEKAKKDRENYSYLCKQFGKTYVDAALKGQVVIGMPELLFVATFKPTLKQQSGNRKLYYVYGWGTYDTLSQTTITNNQLKKTVWVTNGKVSSIRIVNN